MGPLQIAYGLGILAAATRYQTMVHMFLALALVERVLMSLPAWLTKPSPTGHHPPEHHASPLLVPVLAAFLVLATRERA